MQLFQLNTGDDMAKEDLARQHSITLAELQRTKLKCDALTKQLELAKKQKDAAEVALRSAKDFIDMAEEKFCRIAGNTYEWSYSSDDSKPQSWEIELRKLYLEITETTGSW